MGETYLLATTKCKSRPLSLMRAIIGGFNRLPTSRCRKLNTGLFKMFSRWILHIFNTQKEIGLPEN